MELGGSRCQDALPGWGQIGRRFALTEVQVFLLPTCWNPGGSRCFPTRRASVCRLRPSKFSAPSAPTVAELLLAERGPAREGKVAWTGCPGQACVDSFLLLGPRCPCELGVCAVGWEGACAQKVWERKLLLARTRTGKVRKARGAGVGASQPARR